MFNVEAKRPQLLNILNVYELYKKGNHFHAVNVNSVCNFSKQCQGSRRYLVGTELS